MYEILRNLWRRKLRNGLTVSGIMIGVLALTTMGAIAEKANFSIDGGVRYFRDHITVGAAQNGGFGGGILTVDKVDDLKRVDGVQAACASTGVNAKTDLDFSISFGPSDTVIAEQTGCLQYSTFKLTYAKGHPINESGTGEVVLGSDIAKEFKKSVGDTVQLPQPPKRLNPDFVGHNFTVVGILNKTLTAPDNFAFVSFTDGQTLFGDNLPTALRGRIDPTKLATGINVYAKPGVDLDTLANRINDQVTGVRAIPPSTLVNAFKAASVFLTAITTGAALLALIIGGLSVVNTMLMAVSERVREIGLKKAVGAHTKHVLQEFLTEATIIGIIGGTIGLLLGWGLATAINASMAAQNQSEIFLVTTRLVVIALAFSIGLGALAGVVPALRAARLDPVTALRSQ
jgi:putative ABC transport system permease protein